MKKSLFFAAMLAVAAVFVGCDRDNKPGGSKDVTIALSPAELVLSEGGDLTLLLTHMYGNQAIRS